jgi:hypothetical protein
MVGIRNETGIDLFLAVTVGKKLVRFALYSTKPENVKTRTLPAGKDFGLADRPKGTRTNIDMSSSEMTLFAARRARRLVHLDNKSRANGKESYILYTIRLAN